MLEPLGQSQVLAYLEKLASGRRIHLISFEKAADWADRSRRAAVAERIAAAGIRWHPMRYHKSPSAPATAYDIAAGAGRAVGLARRHRLSIVHARSYVPGVMGLVVKRMTGARFLFDMRGFWADERVDGNLWPAGGRLYRSAKAVERRLLLAADYVVTLTHASEEELRRFAYLQGRMPPVSVIPTCADLSRFVIHGPLQRDPFVLGHIGAVGTWYLLDEMLRCFILLREQVPGARLLIANRGEHEMINSRAAAHGISASDMEVLAADPAEVPKLIGQMTAGMAIIKPAFSKIASAPTKLAEYLGCGVPCLGNAGVGDMKTILERKSVGVALPGFSDDEIRAGLRRLIQLTSEPGIQQRCRDAAGELFSLDRGVAEYDSIYRRLADGAAAQ
jgi:glycosyltransferase involved in cell wall biosynthesis